MKAKANKIAIISIHFHSLPSGLGKNKLQKADNMSFNCFIELFYTYKNTINS